MRLTALGLVASCLLAFGTITPLRAAAQDPAATASTADARELFRRGEAAYSAGNYELAIREWNSAYSVDPRPRIQFNLSQAYERLGRLEEAMAALKKFLDSGDPDDPMYSDANARLSALQARLAQTGIMVVGGHEGGTILVDDKEWGRTPRPDKISVAPGSHVLVVRWTGRPEFRTNVQVPAGQVIEVSLPADTGAPVASNQPPKVEVDSSKGMSPIVYYAVGGGLAAAGLGLIAYGAVRSGDAVDCASEGATSGTYCPDPDAADSAGTQSMVGFITGGVLLVGGGVLITLGVLKARKDKREPATAAQSSLRARARAATTRCGVGFASASCLVRF
jgi:hypothetical protein